MTEVHPTFYPETGTWETDDGVRARSVAALASKLGPETSIQDYYPTGFGHVVRSKKKQLTLDLEMEAPIKPLWKEEKVTAVFLPDIKPPLDVPVFLSPKRERKKEPGVHHQKRRKDQAWVFSKVDWVAKTPVLLKMFYAEKSVEEMATALECSENSIIGRVHRLNLKLTERGKPPA